MKIVEFEKKYPNYSLGFLANNSLTDTEKAFGKSMHLLFHTKRNKTYQVFNLSDYEIEEMLKVTPKAGSGYCGAFIVKDVHIRLINDDGLLLGYCVETEERIAFDKPFSVSIKL